MRKIRKFRRIPNNSITVAAGSGKTFCVRQPGKRKGLGEISKSLK